MDYIFSFDDNTKILNFDLIDSTNEEAKRNLPFSSGNVLVLSNGQTSGKGRKGRSFYSPSNTGLYFSYGTRTKCCFDDVLRITTASSVIVSRALKDVLNVDVQIKWVNDLFYCDKKICGILSECFFESDGSIDVIIGIGINLSTSYFPEEISAKAGSVVASLDNPELVKEKLVEYIVTEMQHFFFDPLGFEYISDYKENSCVLNKIVSISDSNGVFSFGRVIDFDESGAIVLQTESGIEAYSNGELSLDFYDLHK